MYKVLIVEDEPAIALDIIATVENSGYENVQHAMTKEEAQDFFYDFDPGIVLMDINLDKGFEGIELAHEFKGYKKDLILLFLTSYSDDAVIEKAIATKPNGYIIKPFKRKEIEVELKLAIQKSQTSIEVSIDADRIELGEGYSYDPKLQNLYYKNIPIELTKKELQLFLLCYEHQGNIVPVDIVDIHLWPDKGVTDSTRRSLIHRVRTKLGGDLFESIQGIGYRLSLKYK